MVDEKVEPESGSNCHQKQKNRNAISSWNYRSMRSHKDLFEEQWAANAYKCKQAAGQKGDDIASLSSFDKQRQRGECKTKDPDIGRSARINRLQKRQKYSQDGWIGARRANEFITVGINQVFQKRKNYWRRQTNSDHRHNSYPSDFGSASLLK